MRVLLLTNMYPSPRNPAKGLFVHTQVESLRALGVEFELLVLRERSRWEYLSGVHAVRTRAARGDFDLIHAFHGLSGFIAVQQRVKPVVVTFVGSDLLGKPDWKGRQTLAGRVVSVLSRHAARRAQQAIVVSNEMAQRLHIAGISPVVLPLGIDLTVFQPRDENESRKREGIDDGRPRVLFVGRTEAPVKRFDLALEAIRTLKISRPDVEFQVVNGRTSADALVDLMNACQCLLLTSRHEGSPQVVKEAMACNLPIVSTRVGDVEERFGDEAGHFIAEPTPSALGSALERAIVYGRTKGRDHVLQFDLPVVAAKLCKIYDAAAASSRQR